MASTYSNLKVQLMATGENATTWGVVTNVNLGTALEEAIVGNADITFASADVTLTLTDTNTSQDARKVRLRCVGVTGGSARNLIVPAIEKPYIIQNDCDDPITIKNVTGAGVTVPAGKTTWVYNDGVNVGDITTYLNSLTVGSSFTTQGDLTIGGGGDLIISSATGGNNTALYSDAQDLLISVNSATRMYFSAAGDIGIGTTSPGAKLDVSGNVRLSGGAANIEFTNGGPMVYAPASNTLCMATGGGPGSPIERVRIAASGNVGIGTNSPSSLLQVAGTVTATTFSGSGSGLTGTATSLSIGGSAASATTAGSATNATNATNWGGGSLTSTVTWSDTANILVPGESSFDVASGGIWGVFDTPATAYMIRAAAGSNVEIGQAGTRGLYVYGSVTATGNVTAYSDAKLKTDLVRIEGALDKLEALTGYTYTRIDSGKRETGLIAQDVQAVLPEAVEASKDDTLSLAYGNMMGLVVEAIKELRAEVAELRAQSVKVIK